MFVVVLVPPHPTRAPAGRGGPIVSRWGRSRRRCAVCDHAGPADRFELITYPVTAETETRCLDVDACNARARQRGLFDGADPVPPPTRHTTRSKCPNPRRFAGYRSTPVNGWAAPEAPVVAVVAEAACRSWTCEHCGQGRAMEVRKHLAAGLSDHARRYRFLTITFADDLRIDRPADVIEARRRRTEFVRELRRLLGRDFEYAEVIEPQKSGRIHLHQITATPRTWPKLPKCRTAPGVPFECSCPDSMTSRAPYRGPCIQKLAHRAGLGFVSVRALRSEPGAVTYLTKYLTKETRVLPLPRYCRRYTYSRRWSPAGFTLGSIRLAYALDVARRIAQQRGEPEPEPGAKRWNQTEGVFVWEYAGRPPPVPRLARPSG